MPVLGLAGAPPLAELLAGELARLERAPDIAGRDVLGFDLMAYDVQPRGASRARAASWCSSPRLDNLASCHAAVSALARRAARELRAATRGDRALRPRGGRQPQRAQGAAGTLPRRRARALVAA